MGDQAGKSEVTPSETPAPQAGAQVHPTPYSLDIRHQSIGLQKIRDWHVVENGVRHGAQDGVIGTGRFADQVHTVFVLGLRRIRQRVIDAD